MLSEPPCRSGHNRTVSFLVLTVKVLKMELSKEQLDNIANRLCALATYCQFVHDEATIGSRLIGVYSKSSSEVVNRLQAVLSCSDSLLDSLHSVSAALDDLLIKDKYLDDVEVSDEH